MKPVNTEKAPAAIGPYSQAVCSNSLVFVSGQLPIDPATGEFAEGGIKELTKQSLLNMQNILLEAGTDLSHVLKTTVFLADMNDFAGMNEVYSEFFTEPFPARSAVAVKTLPKGALVEIECIAKKPCCSSHELDICDGSGAGLGRRGRSGRGGRGEGEGRGLGGGSGLGGGRGGRGEGVLSGGTCGCASEAEEAAKVGEAD
jgi:2-iminobutanoate/2-iminopropanoate deaminase